MAKQKSNRPAPRPASSSDARRLGAQNNRPAQSQGAQRRAARAQKGRSNRFAWLAIGVVIVVAAVLVVINVTGSSKPSASGSSSSSGVTSGQSPLLASLTKMVEPVTTIPLSVFDSVGTNGAPPPLTVTKDQPPLTKNNLPEFVYEGAEFCPYCAVTRWAMVATLARFGTFSDLKMTSSASDDGDIPTFSFLGTTYSSKYITFTPFEQTDRDHNALQTVPSSYTALYAKYDGSDTTGAAATPFNTASQAGIPFIDIYNKYVGSGAPGALNQTVSALYGGGPDSSTATSAAAIAAALHDPSSSVASAIGAKYEIAVANYYSAAICSVDGNMPASVCTASGVKAAAKQFATEKPVS